MAATPRLISGARPAARLRDLDLPGAFLITGSLLLLVYGLTRAPDVGWSNARTIAEFAGAAALLAVFIANEARSRTALLPLRTFRLPGIACSAWPPSGPGAASARPARTTRRRLLAYRSPTRPEPHL